MAAPISVQLYSVREAMADDFAGTVRKIADMGYVGVETAGYPGTTAKQAGQLFKSLGLQVSSAHAPLPIGEKKNEVLDALGETDCPHYVCPAVDRTYFESPDSIKKLCDLFNEVHAITVENGLRFSVHNHWWEFEPVGEQTAFDLYLERLDPAILFEVDTYWAQVAGLDPAGLVKSLGKRAPLLHIKDGPAVRDEPMVALGDGKMDIEAIIAAGAGSTEWLVVELDHCATDMISAVEKSCRYLVDKGWGNAR